MQEMAHVPPNHLLDWVLPKQETYPANRVDALTAAQG